MIIYRLSVIDYLNHVKINYLGLIGQLVIQTFSKYALLSASILTLTLVACQKPADKPTNLCSLPKRRMVMSITKQMMIPWWI